MAARREGECQMIPFAPHLPPEILAQILSQLEDTRDLIRVCRAFPQLKHICHLVVGKRKLEEVSERSFFNLPFEDLSPFLHDYHVLFDDLTCGISFSLTLSPPHEIIIEVDKIKGTNVTFKDLNGSVGDLLSRRFFRSFPGVVIDQASVPEQERKERVSYPWLENGRNCFLDQREYHAALAEKMDFFEMCRANAPWK